MAITGTEICERHLVSAADFGLEVMDLACESIRRQPFAHCRWIKKRSVNSLGRCLQYSMKPYSVCITHIFSLWSYCRQIRAEHISHALPVTVCLLLPDLQILSFISYRFAAVVLLIEFITSANVGQISRLRDFYFRCLPAAGKA